MTEADKIKVLVEALSWYADEANWENWLWPDEGYNSRAREDCGEKARDAIFAVTNVESE